MSGPFNVGDVAVCVDADPCPCTGRACPYQKGKPYRVSAIGATYTAEDGLVQWLQSEALDRWSADCFRHLPKADDSFAAQMRACRPVRDRVPA